MKFQQTNPKKNISTYDRDIVYQAFKNGIITETERALLSLRMIKYFEWMGEPETAETLLGQGYLAIVDNPQNGSRLCPAKALTVTNSGLKRRSELFNTLRNLGEISPDWY